MKWIRRLKLLAYAKVCFENCTNPFDITHLRKMEVTADECIDLSNIIAELIDNDLDREGFLEKAELIEKAEQAYEETQK